MFLFLFLNVENLLSFIDCIFLTRVINHQLMNKGPSYIFTFSSVFNKWYCLVSATTLLPIDSSLTYPRSPVNNPRGPIVRFLSQSVLFQCNSFRSTFRNFSSFLITVDEFLFLEQDLSLTKRCNLYAMVFVQATVSQNCATFRTQALTYRYTQPTWSRWSSGF